MKNTLKSLTLAVLVLMASCSKDENTSEGTPEDQAVEELENMPLEVNAIADNVIIAGGTKNDGALPTPNEGISLDISESSSYAFLIEGFDVALQSDGIITGAYLQFKSTDGSVADGYYDIDLDANNADSFKGKFGKRATSSSKENDETMLDVDFNANIEPGTFCYEICVYDAEGNISAPQEVCLTVEAWGGNENAVGQWNFEQRYFDNDEANVFLPQIANCSTQDGPFFCQEVAFELTTESCIEQEFHELTLNADGTYTERQKQNLSDEVLAVLSPDGVDLSSFENICPDLPILSEDVYTYESSGRWAYIQEEDKLVFIAYSSEEVFNGEADAFNVEPGDGYGYYGFGGFDGEVTLENDKLIISSFEEQTTSFIKQ